MRIAFVGSREFCNEEFVKFTTKKYFAMYPHEFVSGGAKGVDTWTESVAEELGIKKLIFTPDWNKHGKSAGFIRNQLIVDAADLIVAFWDGTSKGTKSTIDLAIKAKKPIDIYIRNI